ncbi:MAG: hypothetical protein ACXACU_00145 [Candidatus Hodarchaeales archaeon]|jgi:hypothetical protein
METPDIIASILVVLALIIAILSTPIRSAFGDMMGSTGTGDLALFAIEAILFIGIIAVAIYGQTYSKA